MARSLVLILLLTTTSLVLASPAQALPGNFRNVDRFTVGGMPSVEDIDALHMLGVDTLVGFHRVPRDVREHAESLGMTIHYFKIRPHMHLVEQAAQIIDEAPMGTVYVHCQHGADRTGLFVAYWLHTRLQYELFEALLTVVAPSAYQVEGLRRVASEYGITLTTDRDSIAFLGQYSGAYLGHGGGLKVRGEVYARGIRRLVDFTHSL